MGPYFIHLSQHTNQQAPTGVETDIQKPFWRIMDINSQHRLSTMRKVHDISVRDTYINAALADAADSLRRAR